MKLKDIKSIDKKLLLTKKNAMIFTTTLVFCFTISIFRTTWGFNDKIYVVENELGKEYVTSSSDDLIEVGKNLISKGSTTTTTTVTNITVVGQDEYASEEAYIKFYSDVYSMNYDLIYKVIYDMTDGFTNKDYVKNNIIGESTMKNKYIECDTKELAILIAVRNIFYYYEDYGFTEKELFVDYEYKSSYSHLEQLAIIGDLVGIDFYLAYALCSHETNAFTSNIFLTKNNPAGIIFSGEWAEFPSVYAGLIELSLEVLKYNMNGMKTPEEMHDTYAPKSDPLNANWANRITELYNLAVKDGKSISIKVNDNDDMIRTYN